MPVLNSFQSSPQHTLSPFILKGLLTGMTSSSTPPSLPPGASLYLRPSLPFSPLVIALSVCYLNHLPFSSQLSSTVLHLLIGIRLLSFITSPFVLFFTLSCPPPLFLDFPSSSLHFFLDSFPFYSSLTVAEIKSNAPFQCCLCLARPPSLPLLPPPLCSLLSNSFLSICLSVSALHLTPPL